MENVKRFKLRKHKKQWLIIGVSTFVISAGSLMVPNQKANASETTKAAVATEQVTPTSAAAKTNVVALKTSSSSATSSSVDSTASASSSSAATSVGSSAITDTNSVATSATSSTTNLVTSQAVSSSSAASSASSTTSSKSTVVASTATSEVVNSQVPSSSVSSQTATSETATAESAASSTSQSANTSITDKSVESAKATSEAQTNILSETSYKADSLARDVTHLQALPAKDGEDGYTKLDFIAKINTPDKAQGSVQLELTDGSNLIYASFAEPKQELKLITKASGGKEINVENYSLKDGAPGTSIYVKLSYDNGKVSMYEWGDGQSESFTPLKTQTLDFKDFVVKSVGIRTYVCSSVDVPLMSVTNATTRKYAVGDEIAKDTLPVLNNGKQYTQGMFTTQITVPTVSNSQEESFVQLELNDSKQDAKTYLDFHFSDSGQVVNLYEKGADTFRNTVPDAGKIMQYKAGDKVNVEIEYRAGKIWFRTWLADQSRPTLATGGGILSFDTFSPDQFVLLGKNVANSVVSTPVSSNLVAGDVINLNAQGQYFNVKETSTPVTWEEAQEKLPTLIFGNNPEYEKLFEGAWKILFETNLFEPTGSSPFSNYVGSGYKPDQMTFQWDTIFATFFASYANQVFDPMTSFNNFYDSQLGNGNIARIYDIKDGAVHSTALDPINVNPPIFALSELDSYNQTGDKTRLEKIASALQAYADWVSINKWSQNSVAQLYWNNGYGNGMDNLATQGGTSGNANTTGDVDMSSQMVIMWNALAKIDNIIGDTENANRNTALAKALTEQINKYTWDEEDQQYYEVDKDGNFYKVDSLAGFWPLLAGVTNADQAKALKDKLFDPNKFWTDMPFPALAKDDPNYVGSGDYWNGGVWAPTNYMVIKGLDNVGFTNEAQQAAVKYIEALNEVYNYSGTFWECYASAKQTGHFILNSNDEQQTVLDPDSVDPDAMYYSPGTGRLSAKQIAALQTKDSSTNMVKPNFVGWTGLGPIALMIEDVLGVNVDTPNAKIDWNLTRIDENGIEKMGVGDFGELSFVAEKRASAEDGTWVNINSNLLKDFDLNVTLNGRVYTLHIPAGAYSGRLPVGIKEAKITYNYKALTQNGTLTPVVDNQGTTDASEIVGDKLADTTTYQDFQTSLAKYLDAGYELVQTDFDDADVAVKGDRTYNFTLVKKTGTDATVKITLTVQDVNGDKTNTILQRTESNGEVSTNLVSDTAEYNTISQLLKAYQSKGYTLVGDAIPVDSKIAVGDNSYNLVLQKSLADDTVSTGVTVIDQTTGKVLGTFVLDGVAGEKLSTAANYTELNNLLISLNNVGDYKSVRALPADAVLSDGGTYVITYASSEITTSKNDTENVISSVKPTDVDQPDESVGKETVIKSDQAKAIKQGATTTLQGEKSVNKARTNELKTVKTPVKSAQMTTATKVQTKKGELPQTNENQSFGAVLLGLMMLITLPFAKVFKKQH
ncbi:MGH1-like glycoside hydrolase domain-containing protein [Loigolactobacillus coryniformis]|uniref:MGH1-like glycoside hydrolase domain-containing protein n=1 Tax=Loigolactobacillus coryniformis TaxID=1610 RepID=UPI00031A1341|nr:trehalase family glycosidase [Loigolactobacillus coryniformis]